MASLFSEENENFTFKVNEDYAKKFQKHKEREELNRLKARYEKAPENSDSSSSSSEDEEILASVVDEPFLKTLSLLKSKDPRIYDSKRTFFPTADNTNEKGGFKNKKLKNKPMFPKDYERKLILENNGMASEDSDAEQDAEPKTLGYHQEQKDIRDGFKKLVQDSDDDQEGLLHPRAKTAQEKKKEEADYIKWLKGEAIANTAKGTKELIYLKEYWNNPKLDQGEAFLKDYILNKRFMEAGDDSYIPTYDEIVESDISGDELIHQKQEEFEHKFNFRYEEPDADFIKRYPRTMENTLRKKNDKRKIQREDLQKRKQLEKARKQEELKRFKALKRKEILDKLKKLKDITGNERAGFDETDLENDFNPDEHDRKMRDLFSEDYYEQENEEEKPVFEFDPEIDADNENWDDWDGYENNEAHCEDPNFNMDAEYNPKAALMKQIIDSTRKGKKKKSKLAEVLSKRKPVFDPEQKSFENYLDEYYKLDYEDIVGGMPVRFSYREVLPNDFGLSVNEILTADDKELNKWASLKKTCQYRTEEEERFDLHAYQLKANNFKLKKKVLHSVYNEEENEEHSVTVQENDSQKVKRNLSLRSSTKSPKSRVPVALNNSDMSVKKKKRKLDRRSTEREFLSTSDSPQTQPKKKLKQSDKTNDNGSLVEQRSLPNSGKIKRKKISKEVKPFDLSDQRLKAYGLNPKKLRNKLIYGKNQGHK